ncbi:hypothetical protein AAEX63_02735 [Luteococcus sp. H138]|uniref:hypothetical protein n=1 Tax=unclassified Luteococcus TaxID=2639923 RepID=UPI00313CEC48
MSILGQKIAGELPSGMELPPELGRLLDWCEERGWCDDLDAVTPTVAPYPPEAGVTTAIFTNEGSMDLALNLGMLQDDRDDAFADRLYQFCQIGSDGTHAAWWLNDTGEQQVVIIGDDFGSAFATTTDFLRALAVGHFELTLGEMGADDVEEEYVNHHLRSWLVDELGVTIPHCADELTVQPEPDPFQEWVASVEESLEDEES